MTAISLLSLGMASPAWAEAPKPKLEVSDDFWPPKSFMHATYTMTR